MKKRAFTYILKPEEIKFQFGIRTSVEVEYETNKLKDEVKVIVYRLHFAPTIFANIKHPVSLVRSIEAATLVNAQEWWDEQYVKQEVALCS